MFLRKHIKAEVDCVVLGASTSSYLSKKVIIRGEIVEEAVMRD